MGGPQEPDTSPGRRRATPAQRRQRRAEVSDLGEVVDAAARLLEARPRAMAEIRRRLTGAGYRQDLVAAAIARLVELGYLDDAAFARAWVESRDRAHPRGAIALRRELRSKGIEAAVIEQVLADRRAPGGDDTAEADPAAAQRLLERQARALARIADPRQRRQRAYALLARHGFDPTVAAEAARRFADPAHGSADDEGPAVRRAGR